MTCRQELENLRKDLAPHGIKVTFSIDAEGWIDAVFITGEGIRKEYWDSVLSAAEYMRRLLFERQTTRMYGHLHQYQGKRFINGRWKEATR